MFATVQLQAHRGEKARKNRVSEEKEEVDPGAQLQKRVIGNERRSYKAGSGSWRVMLFEKGAPGVVSTYAGSPYAWQSSRLGKTQLWQLYPMTFAAATNPEYAYFQHRRF